MALQKKISHQFEILPDGKWFDKDFCNFQYGELSEDCNPHRKYIELLKKAGLFKRVSEGYSKGTHTLEEQEKEEEEEKEDRGVQGGKTKRQFLDFVFLTEAEYEKLMQKLNGQTDQYITRLNGWAHQIGPRKFAQYKSHYHTILNWWNRDHGLTGAKTGNHVGPEGAQTLTPTQQRNCERLKRFNEKMDRMEGKPCEGSSSTGQ
jgi:hypothetical protein